MGIMSLYHELSFNRPTIMVVFGSPTNPTRGLFHSRLHTNDLNGSSARWVWLPRLELVLKHYVSPLEQLYCVSPRGY